MGGARTQPTNTSRRKGTHARAAAPPPESHLSQLGLGLLQLVHMKQVITLHAVLTLPVKAGELLADQSDGVQNGEDPGGTAPCPSLHAQQMFIHLLEGSHRYHHPPVTDP